MSTFAWPIMIEWGTDSAPASVYVIDAAGGVHVPTLTSPIAETPAGSGAYAAVATFDTAWGAAKDWWRDAAGAASPGDGPTPAANVTHVFGTALNAGYVPADLQKVLGADPNMVTNFGGISVKTVSPTDSAGNTVLVAGDDYVAGGIEDRRLTYTVKGFTGTVGGATVFWKLVSRKAYDNDDAATPELSITSGTASVAGNTLTLQVPITRAQTAGIRHLSTTATDWRYKVACGLTAGSGETITAVLVDCAVLKRAG